MNPISRTIIEQRKSKGLTQEELADLAQVNLRTIQRIENNENEPRGKTLQLICEALELDIQSLTLTTPDSKSGGNIQAVVNGLFLIALNLLLMALVGFMTFDSNANLNSRFGGFVISILLPIIMVFLTRRMTGLERMLKFGFGYISYFIIVMIFHGFAEGFVTGLFPCLLISLAILYFGNALNHVRD